MKFLKFQNSCFKKSLCIAISNGLDKLKARKNARIRPSILMHFTEDGFHIEQDRQLKRWLGATSLVDLLQISV
ncbi:hypothetical protein T02_5351 [Trichinella nativa]|uniref:Uncharacterized protein n=1 Tax=Trichinella nativa TaxID=6335 RepID=A0A0V1LCU1_9BILA|nr:hypothetical protein T02_5351 [Trichinella nativa]